MIRHLFIALAVIFSIWNIHAAENFHKVTLCRTTNPNDPEPGDDDKRGPHRAPGMAIICSMTEDGVEIPGVDKDEILAFEIYDADGCIISSYDNAIAFTDCLFSLSGDYEIRLLTREYIYIGYIQL